MKKLLAIIIMVFWVAACHGKWPTEEKKPETDKITRTMSVVSPEGQLSNWSCVINGKAYIKLISGLGPHDVANLWTDFKYFQDVQNVKEVNVLIISGGGNAFAGLALADEIERAKKRGITVNGHASGIIASATVPVFAVCSKRYAAPGTIFMVHEASIFKYFSDEKASDIRAQNELMIMLSDKYIGKLVANSKLSKDEWIAKEARTTWFTAEDAKAWGLVDAIE